VKQLPIASWCHRIQDCAGAYRSFRAADCTYQPFDGGARRFCEKSPGQRMAREREQPDRRRWSGDTEPRYLDRSTAGHRFVDEDDDAVDFDDFLFARRLAGSARSTCPFAGTLIPSLAHFFFTQSRGFWPPAQ
jgi:BA14K-like protein